MGSRWKVVVEDVVFVLFNEAGRRFGRSDGGYGNVHVGKGLASKLAHCMINKTNPLRIRSGNEQGGAAYAILISSPEKLGATKE